MTEERTWFSHWRLRFTGIGGAALFCASVFGNFEPWPLWIFSLGIVCASSGLLLRMWATGWLVKNETLTVAGPYRVIRNPLYLGTLLIAIGQSLMSDVPWAPLVFPSLCLALYWPTMRQEQEYLHERYGESYTTYAERVPLLMPGMNLMRNGQMETEISSSAMTQGFAWRRVRRCYKGFLANALVILAYAFLHLSKDLR